MFGRVSEDFFAEFEGGVGLDEVSGGNDGDEGEPGGEEAGLRGEEGNDGVGEVLRGHFLCELGY